MSAKERPSFWSRIRAARVPELLGVYAGASFGMLQGGDIFVERLGLPDWTFFGVVFLLLAGVPVVVVTALVQHARKAGEGVRAESALLARAEGRDSGDVGAAPPESSNRMPSRLQGLFTWRNTGLAGGGAVLLLTAAVALFMALRALGIGPLGSLVAAGVLDREEAILIADFQSPVGDTLLAAAVTEAFRIDFEQSPLVRVVGPGTVREGLIRMQRPPDSRLTPELARELALREGIKAVLTGEIHPAGGGSILSVRLTAVDTEETLVSFRESVSDPAAIIPAVDRLSNRMRERIGESLRTIRAGEPLERVSTASLPALRRYSQGVRAAELERDFPRGIALLEEAIAMDSTFAMAWRKLGVTLSNAGYPRERWEEAYTQAYESRDRLTERERYLTEAAYFSHVVGDDDRAVVAYRTLLDLYPMETAALNNLAVILGSRGDLEGAAELYERALAADSTRPFYYTNLLNQQVALGHWEEAERILERYRDRFPDLATGDLFAGHFAAARGEYQRAAEFYRAVEGNPRSGLSDRIPAADGLQSLALIRGRLTEARSRVEEFWELRSSLGLERNPVEEEAYDLGITLHVVADTAAALRGFDEALTAHPLSVEAAAEGAHLEAAEFLAAAGQVDRARQLLQEWDRSPLEEGARERFAGTREDLLSFLAAKEGRFEEALAHFRRRYTEERCQWCMAPILAEIQEKAGRPDSAIVYYESYLDGSGLHRRGMDGLHLPRIHERLGRLYEEAGDLENARHHYRRFIELWEEADPPLQPRVQEARQRLEAIGEP